MSELEQVGKLDDLRKALTEINEKLRKGSVDEERARRIIEEQVEEVVSTLRMNSEEKTNLRRAALEGQSIPFEFERTGRRRVTEIWEERQREEKAKKLAKTESILKRHWNTVDDAVVRAVLLDQITYDVFPDGNVLSFNPHGRKRGHSLRQRP